MGQEVPAYWPLPDRFRDITRQSAEGSLGDWRFRVRISAPRPLDQADSWLARGWVYGVGVLTTFVWTGRSQGRCLFGVCGSSCDRVLELPHAGAERSADLGKPSCSEEKKDEEQEECEVGWVF
jgi:hypothetical protein